LEWGVERFQDAGFGHCASSICSSIIGH
jgi:hypothetical protein